MGDIVIVSGGLDSVTLLHHLTADTRAGQTWDVLSFNYGQRHAARELACAAKAAARLGVRHDIIDLSPLGFLLAPSGSALVSDTPVPEGHYAAATMTQTVVPNRNMIMLSIAASVAVARDGQLVAAAVHAGDHFIYPDCRPEFFTALEEALRLGNDGIAEPGIWLTTPFIHWSKADIARRAGNLGVPVAETWSCYLGGEVHCGRCGTCVERLEAVHLAGVKDPTVYADPDYWRTQITL